MIDVKNSFVNGHNIIDPWYMNADMQHKPDLPATHLHITVDYMSVPKEIEKYRTGGGNKGRQASEATLSESANYDATH